MTNEHKIEKLEKVIEESFAAFRLLPELSVCSFCDETNKTCVEKIFVKIENAIKLKKEIL